MRAAKTELLTGLGIAGQDRLMKIIFVGITLFVATTAMANISDSTKTATQNAAFEQFTQWMKDRPSYKISATDLTETHLKSGHEAVEVLTVFDDGDGCVGRVHVTVCAPQGENRLVCGQAMTDCRVPMQSLEQTIQLAP